MVDSFNWHYVFFMGLPLAAAAFVLAIIFLPRRSQIVEPRPFDWFGFAFMIIFLINLFLRPGQRGTLRMGIGESRHHFNTGPGIRQSFHSLGIQTSHSPIESQSL